MLLPYAVPLFIFMTSVMRRDTRRDRPVGSVEHPDHRKEPVAHVIMAL